MSSIDNIEVLKNLRFLMENTKSDYSRREYEELMRRFLRDNSPRLEHSIEISKEEKEKRLAERDAKQAAEKVEKKDTRIADRNAYIQNHLIPEIIHSCFQLDTAAPNYAQTVQLTLARIEGLKQACENFTGTYDNRVEKHKKDGDLYNDSLRRRASELRENLVNIK
jgi:hypothetical protein